ncbi:hypothetical protein PM082_016292 [Marasmius tenuissimus]|nr:hypothetical protein PM082_016292 [Marasmius tenuissimus]
MEPFQGCTRIQGLAQTCRTPNIQRVMYVPMAAQILKTPTPRRNASDAYLLHRRDFKTILPWGLSKKCLLFNL